MEVLRSASSDQSAGLLVICLAPYRNCRPTWIRDVRERLSEAIYGWLSIYDKEMLLDLPFECVLATLKRVDISDVLATGCCCKALRLLVTDDKFWCDLAEAKWGTAVRQLKAQADDEAQQAPVAVDDQPATACRPAASDSIAVTGDSPWFDYTSKRMCLKSIRPSPLSLLQEAYPDPWQHIICCVLCSRTSGSNNIKATIAEFFQAFPTPTAVLEADDDIIKLAIHPLGLQASRLSAVRGVSCDFLGTNWHDPSQFKGCGKFVSDSWKIFCKANRDAKGVDDAKLKQYLAWLNKETAKPDCSPKAQLESAEKLVRQHKKPRAGHQVLCGSSRRITRSQAAVDSHNE